MQDQTIVNTEDNLQEVFQEQYKQFSSDQLREVQKNNYFNKIAQELVKIQKSQKTDFEKIKEANLLIDKIIQDSRKKLDIIATYKMIKQHQLHIENKQFSWLLFQEDIYKIQPILKLIVKFDKFENHEFLKLGQFRYYFPLKYFEKYFQEPFGNTEDDVNLSGLIYSFHSDLLQVFYILYIKDLFCLRSEINAEKIITVDPFMRNTIRSDNINYFLQYFPNSEEFDLYQFLINIINNFTLSGGPRKRFNTSKPLELPLIKIFLTLFKHGLVTTDFSRTLIRYLYFTVETIFALEKQVEKDDQEGEMADKYYKDFLKMREMISSILIHYIALYGDLALEESQVQQFESAEIEQVEFSKFLFKQKSVFNYFCNILLKYLSQQITLNKKTVVSDELSFNLGLIFNFIGDFQNDIYILSMDLINIKNYEYYYNILKNKITYSQKSQKIQAVQLAVQMRKLVQNIQDSNLEINQVKKDYTQIIVKAKQNFESVKSQDRLFFSYELSRQNFQSPLVQILQLIIELEDNNDILFESLILLTDICDKNYVAQGLLFRGQCENSFLKIAKLKPNLCLLMIMQAFKSDSYLLYLSPKLFLQNIELFKQLLEDIKNLLGLEQNDETNKKIRSTIVSLLLFYQYFYDILENHKIKMKRRKKYDVIIAQVLNSYMVDYIKSLVENLKHYQSETETLKLYIKFNELNFTNIEKFINYYQTCDIKEVKVKFFYYMLKLFNKSTYSQYSGEVLESIRKYNIVNHDIDSLKIKSPDFFLIKLEQIKLFDRFSLFIGNHLLSKRTTFNRISSLICGEVFLPKDIDYTVEQFVKSQITWLDDFIQKNESQKNQKEFLQLFENYLGKGLFALLYKFYKGVQYHITKNDKQELNYYIESLKNIQKLIDECKANLNSYFQEEQLTIFQKRLDLFSFRNKFKNQVNPQKKNNNQEVKIYEEELPIEKIQEIRKMLSHQIGKLETFYSQNSEYTYIIQRYQRKPTRKNVTKYMKRTMNTSKLVQKFIKEVNYKTKAKEDKFNHYKTYYKPLKKQYKIMKSYYNKNPIENQFNQILVNKKSAKQIETFLQFFINQIQYSNLSFTEFDSDRHFFCNDYFIYFIIIVDNLMQWNPLIRVKLTEYLMKNIIGHKEQSAARNFLRQIWRCFTVLLQISLFKTFMDKDWEEYWSKFFIISKFLQNLCESNDPRFKEFLNEKEHGLGQFEYVLNNIDTLQTQRSLFFELYIWLEVSATYSYCWLNKHSEFMPTDKPEIFVINRRLLDVVTENLQGPCLKNQLNIYTYRIDIWTGIISRIIDDTDSEFYEMQISCIGFIKALLEDNNPKITSFFGSNFKIHKLYDLIVRLIKKLYIRRYRINKKVDGRSREEAKQVNDDDRQFLLNKQNNDWEDLDTLRRKYSVVTQEDEEKYELNNSDDLLYYYKKYEHDFSSHQLLLMATETYFLIQNLSSQIKFFEFFKKEKIEQKSQKNLSRKQKEENIVLDFIEKITDSVEIIQKKSTKTLLKRIYFRKEPKCFFLSNEDRNNFLDKIDISSVSAKHYSLFQIVPQFDYQMEQSWKLFKKRGINYKFFTSDFFIQNQIVLYIFSIILNLTMLLLLEATNIQSHEIDNIPGLDSSPTQARAIHSSIALIIVIYSFILSAMWLTTKFRQEAILDQIRKKRIKGKTKLVLTFQNIIENKLFIRQIFHPRFMSFFFHFIFTILGIFYDNWFFTLNLFLVTNLSQTINYILKSIFQHFNKLLITLAFTILLIFCYAFLFIKFFSSDINTEEYGTQVCTSFLSCFFNAVNMGMRLGGGLSDFLYVIGKPQTDKYWERLFFDLTFFIFIQLIFLNIVSGIIIDTFSQMRDEMNQRNHDYKYYCHICGMNKWQIEKHGQNFVEHRRKNHKLWSYVYLLIRLLNTDISELNTVEFYLNEKFTKDDSSWLPQSMFLQENENLREQSQVQLMPLLKLQT